MENIPVSVVCLCAVALLGLVALLVYFRCHSLLVKKRNEQLRAFLYQYRGDWASLLTFVRKILGFTVDIGKGILETPDRFYECRADLVAWTLFILIPRYGELRKTKEKVLSSISFPLAATPLFYQKEVFLCLERKGSQDYQILEQMVADEFQRRLEMRAQDSCFRNSGLD